MTKNIKIQINSEGDRSNLSERVRPGEETELPDRNLTPSPKPESNSKWIVVNRRSSKAGNGCDDYKTASTTEPALGTAEKIQPHEENRKMN